MKGITHKFIQNQFGGYRYKQVFEQNGNTYGCLIENEGFAVIPVVNNLIFNTESDFSLDIISEQTLPALQKKLSRIDDYEKFVGQKGRKQIYDPYACFQPFNEATKSIYPLLEIVRSKLRPGDVILNLWDRSGWLTSVLLGIFPDCQVVTTWDGNKDVLGYVGYHYWFGTHGRLNVLFTDLEKPLPLKSSSIDLMIGFDVLHRYPQHDLLNELQRVSKDTAPLLFPHVHLSNAEPIPYFDRGCRQLHGKIYEEALTKSSRNTGRLPFVLSEPELFKLNQKIKSEELVLTSAPDMSDYNAHITLLPAIYQSKKLKPLNVNIKEAPGSFHVIVNHLLKYDLSNQRVSVDAQHLSGMMGHILERHPPYQEYISTTDNYLLSTLETLLLFLSDQVLSVEELCNRFEKEQVLAALQALQQHGIIEVMPIDDNSARLQKYLASQKFLKPRRAQNLPALWQEKVSSFHDSVFIAWMKDDSVFTFGDADQIIHSICSTLEANGIQSTSTVLVIGTDHPEAVLLFWACMHLGITFVPIAGQLVPDALMHIIEETEPSLVFATKDQLNLDVDWHGVNTVVFDEDDEAVDHTNFSGWLQEVTASKPKSTEVGEDHLAVILYTSGSTGTPKGVKLTHGSLWRSANTMVDHFDWKPEDRYFSLGGLHTMSGLRNSAICPLFSGCTTVLAHHPSQSSFIHLIEQIKLSRATIIATNPSFLRMCLQVGHKYGHKLSQLRLVLCTGNHLTPELRAQFSNTYRLDVHNYYGHTETSGICIAESLNTTNRASTSSIGRPVDAIVQIVDAQRNLVDIGEIGELRVYSLNLFEGYQGKEERRTSDFWFYTGDLARHQENGVIELIGRTKEIIKRPGEEIIYVNHVAELARANSKVIDAASIIITERDVDRFILCLTIDQTNDQSNVKNEIKRSIKSRLGRPWQPDHVLVMDHLPYNIHGKLEKQTIINAIQKHSRGSQSAG